MVLPGVVRACIHGHSWPHYVHQQFVSTPLNRVARLSCSGHSIHGSDPRLSQIPTQRMVFSQSVIMKTFGNCRCSCHPNHVPVPTQRTVEVEVIMKTFDNCVCSGHMSCFSSHTKDCSVRDTMKTFDNCIYVVMQKALLYSILPPQFPSLKNLSWKCLGFSCTVLWPQ